MERAAQLLANAKPGASSAAGSATVPMGQTGYELLIRRLVTKDVWDSLRTAQVLWLDRNPEYNVNERRALQALGMTVVTAMSPDTVIANVQEGRWSLVITEFGKAQQGSTRAMTMRSVAPFGAARVSEDCSMTTTGMQRDGLPQVSGHYKIAGRIQPRTPTRG